jgi:ribosomal protein S18 acetylase RimI-like enzyme
MNNILILQYYEDEPGTSSIARQCEIIMVQNKISSSYDLLLYAEDASVKPEDDSDEYEDTDPVIVGCLYYRHNLEDNCYMADLAIRSDYQRKGIGSKLIDEFIDFCKEQHNSGVYQNMYDEVDEDDEQRKDYIRLHVVNPNIVNMLKRKGFEIDGIHGYEHIMTRDI